MELDRIRAQVTASGFSFKKSKKAPVVYHSNVSFDLHMNTASIK